MSLLKKIKSKDKYKKIQTILQKSLEQQWRDLILSGMINTLFKRYKEFFVKPKDKKVYLRKNVFLKADDFIDENDNGVDDREELITVDDVRSQEKDTLQGDKFVIPLEALDKAALLAFIYALSDKNMNTIGSYYSLKPELKDYLKYVANQGGQEIVDTINRDLEFRLSKKEYIAVLNKRVDSLVKTLDETTKKKVVSEIFKGVKAGESKSDMVKRLEKAGKKISENRAKLIAEMETQSALQYMRYETAKLNGLETKIWRTAEDEKVCQVCQPLDGIEIPINRSFESYMFSGPTPPAHVLCRCDITYEYRDKEFMEYIKTSTNNFIDKISFLKKKEDSPKLYEYSYSVDDDGVPKKIVNPNAVWAGGESLVGKDKMVGNYKYEIEKLPKYKERIKKVLVLEGGRLQIDSSDFVATNKTETLIAEARNTLTDIGFIQLLLSLGIKKKIPSKL